MTESRYTTDWGPPLQGESNRPYQIDVLGVGELLIDLISTEPAPSLRDTVEFRRYQGGAPANLVLNVAKLGGRSALIAKIGIGAFGQYCKNELSRFGVLTDYLVMDHRTRTTMVFVARTKGTPDFEVARQGDAALRVEEVSDEAISRARLIHVSAFALSREPCRSAVQHAVREAKAAGKLVSLDPNYHPDIWPDLFEAKQVLGELYPLVDLTKPSMDDAERIFGPGRSPEEYARRFAAMGARIVVLTTGPGEALLCHEGLVTTFPTPRVRVADATGAGDAYWAGFIVAYLDGRPPEQCMQFARTVAEIKLRTVGPLPANVDRDEIYAALSTAGQAENTQSAV